MHTSRRFYHMLWCEDAPKDRYRRRLIRLTFLAPDLQKSIFEGRHTAGLTLARLLSFDIPLSWEVQNRVLAEFLIN